MLENHRRHGRVRWQRGRMFLRRGDAPAQEVDFVTDDRNPADVTQVVREGCGERAAHAAGYDLGFIDGQRLTPEAQKKLRSTAVQFNSANPFPHLPTEDVNGDDVP